MKNFHYIFLGIVLLLIIVALLLTKNNFGQSLDLENNVVFSRWWR